MQHRIAVLKEKKFIGKRVMISFAINRTGELWRSFMPARKNIRNQVGSDLFSIEVYPPLFFDRFDPASEFEKWAAVEVTDFTFVPDGMEAITVPGGLYAVFSYVGPASAASSAYQHIFATWLPQSDFLLDDRPHLAVMGAGYKHEDPGSEEELWIPVKPRTASA